MVRIGWTTESRPMCSAKDCNRKAADHETETQQPDAPADGVGHQAQAHGGLLWGILDAHALEHAGQRIGECRCYGKDIDHRLSAKC